MFKKGYNLKVVSFVTAITFCITTIAYGLDFSNNSHLRPPIVSKYFPETRRKMIADMHRESRNISVAGHIGENRDRLNEEGTQALIRRNGIYVVDQEVYDDDLRLIRYITHEDYELLMQRMQVLHRGRYERIMEQVLHNPDIMTLYYALPHHEPAHQNQNRLFNDIISQAFELLYITEDLVDQSDLTQEERAFLAIMMPILRPEGDEYANFFKYFFDLKEKSKIVAKIQEEGVIKDRKGEGKRIHRVTKVSKEEGKGSPSSAEEPTAGERIERTLIIGDIGDARGDAGAQKGDISPSADLGYKETEVRETTISKIKRKKFTIFSTLSFVATLIVFVVFNDKEHIAIAIKPFLPLLLPAVIIMGGFILYEFRLVRSSKLSAGHKEGSKSKKWSRRTFLRASLGAGLATFIANLSGVNLLYIFSRDRSFKSWKYGYLNIDEIARVRPVGTESLPVSTPQLGPANFNITPPPIIVDGIGKIKVIRALHQAVFIDELRGLELEKEINEEKIERLIEIVDQYRPKYDSYFGDYDEYDRTPNLMSMSTAEELEYVNMLISELRPDRFPDWQSQWAAADLRILLLEIYVNDRYYFYEYYGKTREDDFNVIEFIKYIEEFIDTPFDFTRALELGEEFPSQFLSLADTYRLRVLNIERLESIFQAIERDYPEDADALILLGQIRERIEGEKRDIESRGLPHRRDIDDLAYRKPPVYSEEMFGERVEYYRQLQHGPRRPVAIENVEAVRKAREILLPLKADIQEIAEAHNIPPDIVATFILYNKMIKDRFPTYDLKEGLGMFFWHHDMLPDDVGIDEARSGQTGYPFYDMLAGILPTDMKLQDSIADRLGSAANTSPTSGLMQVRAGPVKEFPEERNVKTHGLWKRLGIDASNLSNREINQMLLTNPYLAIEAGVAALRQEIDRQIELQEQGERASMPLAPSFEDLLRGSWIYENYDNYAVEQFGPDFFLWMIITNFPFSPTIQNITNALLTDDLRNADFPLFHIIALESGVFDEEPIPSVIVGVTTPERVDYVYQIAREEDPYLSNAAIRSLRELVNDVNPEIAQRARNYLIELGLMQQDSAIPAIEGLGAAVVAMGVLSNSLHDPPKIDRRQFLTLGLSGPRQSPETQLKSRGSTVGLMKTLARMGKFEEGATVTVSKVHENRFYEHEDGTPDETRQYSETTVRRELRDAEDIGLVRRIGKNEDGKDEYEVLAGATSERLQALVPEEPSQGIRDLRTKLDMGRVRTEERAEIREGLQKEVGIELAKVPEKRVIEAASSEDRDVEEARSKIIVWAAQSVVNKGRSRFATWLVTKLDADETVVIIARNPAEYRDVEYLEYDERVHIKVVYGEGKGVDEFGRVIHGEGERVDGLGLKPTQIIKDLSETQLNKLFFELTTYYEANGIDLDSLSELIDRQKEVEDDLSRGV
ncbi:MAG: hypothetical protein KKA34_03800 [Candidatus Omnitrophica bacterium]|nr:hypothetical protein [Candidatus Omnitrophota bacterium]